MDNYYDCLIVGAGISGLFSAREILKKHPDWNVALAESYKSLGGRTATYKHDGVQWEEGAGRIHKSHKHTMKLIKEYGLTWIPIGNKTMFKNDENSPITPNTFDDFSKPYLKSLMSLSEDVLAKHTMESVMKLVYGSEFTKLFFSYFPYRAEVNTLRSDLALKSFLDGEMSDHSGYGVIKEGFGELVSCLTKDIKRRGCKILSEYTLLNIKENTGLNECIFDKKTVCARKVILALTRDAVAKLPAFYGWHVLRYLKAQPLLRVYGVFNKPWFPSSAPIVTPGPLRYIIPVGPKVIMVSYTDNDDTKDYARVIKSGGDKALQKVIMGQTRKLFPELDIPEPILFKSHLWRIGATYWLPGKYSPETLSKKSIHPLPSVLPRVWLCGESWSLRQAWVEGALEQTILCLSVVDRK